jgi:hypothetical protein
MMTQEEQNAAARRELTQRGERQEKIDADGLEEWAEEHPWFVICSVCGALIGHGSRGDVLDASARCESCAP